MLHKLRKCSAFLSLCFLLPAAAFAVASAAPASDATLNLMNQELQRSISQLKSAGAAPVYFIAYRLYRGTWSSISAENGALRDWSAPHSWGMLNVDLRVGSPQFDNTHRMRGRNWDARPTVFESTHTGSMLPIEPSDTALRQLLWLKTDEAFKEAQKRFSELKGNNEVLVAEEDSSGDFSVEPPHTSINLPPPPHIDTASWEERVRRLSQLFSKHSFVRDSWVNFDAAPATRYIVNSEGTRVASELPYYAASMSATTLTDDGMNISLYENVASLKPEDLPTDAKLTDLANKMLKQLEALRNAPPADPYVGPAILSGKASAVLFHEILGHRIEGLRQKDENDARTFSNKIGSRIMPSFISVIDDPTVKELNGTKLAGTYEYDDEGVPASRVLVVNDGVLQHFLLSRSPIKGFPQSNGHGRSAPGWNPVARQGNLIVEVKPSKQFSEEQLRAMLIKEAKRQHKDYGLYFTELSGGETFTSAFSPQSISLYPLVVYKIFVDGRPDQLIRGVDLVGTPLLLLEKIMAAGKNVETFNGQCGAESGGVPVSATAPSLLIQSVEVQRKAKQLTKSPILPDPTREAPAAGEGSKK